MSAPESRPVAVIGAGLDLGAGRRGVDMGPSAIRYAGLSARLAEIGCEVHDSGDIPSPVPEATEAGEGNARYLGPILAACELLAELVADAASRGQVPVTLGGMAAIRGAGGVLWIDAHGDLNRPETSPTGNVHGMPLAAALGVAGDAFARAAYPTPSVTKAALLGIRALDPGERELIRELGLRVYTMKELDERGVQVCTAEALDYLRGSPFVHVSLDLDAVDPMFAPGVGTPVRGGLSYREAHLALELVSESGLADSLDVVEVNPILDRENETGALAVELVASALGARIL